MSRVLAACLMALLAVNAQARIYKCKDANGQIRYSDNVCAATGSDNAATLKKTPSTRPSEKAATAKPPPPSPPPPAESASSSPRVPPSNYTCQGKTRCTEMTSCEEAVYYLKHCPGVKIDGDNDGTPCEDQWCP